MTKDDLKAIKEIIGYNFKNDDYLQQAFIRKSYSKENGGENNEVLEFIGDKALDFSVVIALSKLYGSETSGEWKEYHSEKNEGQLTDLKRKLVNKSMLAHRIDFLNLSQYLIMGRGDINKNIQEEESVKEDLFEAIIGAVAIDSKYDINSIYSTVIQMLDPAKYLSNGFDLDFTNYIQEVQEWNQSYDKSVPEYKCVLGMNGRYKCTITITNPIYKYSKSQFIADGLNKSEARMNAAEKAYVFLEENGFLDEEHYFIDIVGEPDEDEAVAQLNILSTKGYFSTPNYDFTSTYDKDGNPIWKCVLTIDEYDYKIKKVASSKKDAKKLCAYEMLCKIIDYE